MAETGFHAFFHRDAEHVREAHQLTQTIDDAVFCPPMTWRPPPCLEQGTEHGPAHGSFTQCCLHARKCPGAQTPHQQQCQFPRVHTTSKSCEAHQEVTDLQHTHSSVNGLSATCLFPDGYPLECLQRQLKFYRSPEEHLRTDGCQTGVTPCQEPLSRSLVAESKQAFSCLHHVRQQRWNIDDALGVPIRSFSFELVHSTAEVSHTHEQIPKSKTAILT